MLRLEKEKLEKSYLKLDSADEKTEENALEREKARTKKEEEEKRY